MSLAIHFVSDTPPRRLGPADRTGPSGDAAEAVLSTPVLIIEDEAIIAWMIEEVLEDAGFRSIELVASGAQALEAARRRAPGMIISDVNLGGGIDGVEASSAICGERDIPVIFVTGFATDTMRERLARELPRARLLRKPLRGPELIAAVMRALAH